MDLREGKYPKTSRAKRKQLIQGLSKRDQALYRWANVSDLDSFLGEVYAYYIGKGWQCILLKKVLDLLTVGFVIAFTTFLLGCIDYTVIKKSHHLEEVVMKKCVNRLSGFTLLLVLAFALFYIQRVVSFGFGVRKLWEMHDFFQELLEIPEGDLQTIPWYAVVSRLATLKEHEGYSLSSMRSMGGKGHLDAHEVANRIMRSENYLIALFNKDVLDLSLQVPLPNALTDVGSMFGAEERPRLRVGEKKIVLGGGLTRALEWNLGVCLLGGFLFGKDGQVRHAFMKEKNKLQLTEALIRRFKLMAIINGIFAFFIVIYLIIYSFFRYFEEYHKNPSSMGSRTYTQLARWKFREFNELPHLFQQRLSRSYEPADTYIQQFPKEKTAIVSRFVAFISGSFAAVLVLFSLLDPDAFLHFEITPGGTVLFYIGIFGTIMAVARGMVPDDHRVVNPEELMRSIADHTHYLPTEWKGRLHSAEVHQEFSQLFQMKITIFFQEIVSVILTPFILWFSLPSCAPAIIEFFRVCSVHVDGLGYVTSFAEFNFERHGNPQFGAPVPVKDGRWMSNNGKMEKSILNFKAVRHSPWSHLAPLIVSAA
ncbi:APG9-domain-containing protein [Atractiella rhizophila]|nr:APG9-domain-containing protein [Atractiella rhizophila]